MKKLTLVSGIIALTILSFGRVSHAQTVTPEIRITNIYQIIEERGSGCSPLPGTRSVGIIQYLVFEIIPPGSTSDGGWDRWVYLYNRNGFYWSFDLLSASRVVRLRGIYTCASDTTIEQIRQALLSEGWYFTGVYYRADGTRVPVTSTIVLPQNEILPKKALVPVRKMSTTKDPINIATGEMLIEAVDFSIPGPGPDLAIRRTYRSQSNSRGLFGYGWRSDWDLNLQEDPQGNVIVFDGSGTGRYFARNANATYTASPGNYATLSKDANGSFQITEKNGIAAVYADGRLSTLTDRNGNQLRCVWQAEGTTFIEDAVGRKIMLELDSQDRVTQARDPLGRVVSYTYDSSGNLATITDPAGGSTRYAYDADHNIIEMTNANGHKTYFAYDASDRAVRNWQDQDVNKVELSFLNNTTIVTDSLGRQSRYAFNEFGLQTQYTDPLGKNAANEWDENLQLVRVTDRAGRSSEFTYDDRGNPLTSVDPLGQTTAFTYTSDFSLINTVTDAAGAVTTNSYDTRGNRISTIDPLGGITLIRYDTRGNPLMITDPAGGVSLLEYNALSQLAASTDSLGQVTRMTYDAAGNLLTQSDALNRQTAFAYDPLNRLIRTEFPDGTNQTCAYDAFGNRVNVTDRIGRITAYVYDEYERLIRTRDPALAEVSAVYDAEGNILSLRDQKNQTTRYCYDALNRKIAETDALGMNVTFTYDDAGNIISRTDRNGNRTLYTYDALNRPVQTSCADGSNVTQSYDALGRRLRMTDRFGTTAYEYDANSRLMKVDGPETGDTITYTYDVLGRRTGMTDQNARTFSYSYDGLGRLLQVTAASGSTNYAYDAAGNQVSVVYPNGAVTNITYDAMNRPLTVSNSAQNVVVSSFDYVYDPAGRVIKRTTQDGLYREYTYDLLDRMVSERQFRPGEIIGGKQRKSKELYSSEFSYDDAGNRRAWVVRTRLGKYWREKAPGADEYLENFLIAAGYQRKIDNACPLTITKTYGYDDANRLLTYATNLDVEGTLLYPETVTYTYDDNGNRIREERVRPESVHQVTDYSYDGENRLIGIQYNGKPEAAFTSAAYSYNGDGLRVKAIEGETVRTYNYDGGDVLFEKDADGAVVRAYTRAPGFAGGISGIISQRTDVPVVIGKGKNRRVVYIPKDLYYLYDAQGNVVNLADGFGVLTSAYEYDSYGGKMREEDPTGNMYQFSTKELEPHAGLLYFGARYYDPAVGRWLTPDPLGMADGTNVYAYCGNDPVNRVDPWGLLTIIMHGIGSHAVGYSGALRDYLEQNGETVIEYYWSGNLDNMAEQDQVASNIGSLLNSARKLADALGEDLNVIAHSQGTRLTYKGILRSSANVDNFVTLGSPYASQYSMPPNVSRWTNIWSQTDPISYPSIVTAADDFRITSRHENYWTKEVLNAELLRILNKKLFSLGKERK